MNKAPEGAFVVYVELFEWYKFPDSFVNFFYHY